MPIIHKTPRGGFCKSPDYLSGLLPLGGVPSGKRVASKEFTWLGRWDVSPHLVGNSPPWCVSLGSAESCACSDSSTLARLVISSEITRRSLLPVQIPYVHHNKITPPPQWGSGNFFEYSEDSSNPLSREAPDGHGAFRPAERGGRPAPTPNRLNACPPLAEVRREL